MNRLWIFWVGFLGLSFIGVLIYSPWLNNSTHFGFRNANSICSITISNTLNHETISLKKCDKAWCIKQNSEEAQQDRVCKTLFVLQNLEVRQSLTQEQQIAYRKSIESGGLKIQLNTRFGIKRLYSLYKVDSVIVGVIGRGNPYVVGVNNNEGLDLIQILNPSIQSWKKTLVVSILPQQIQSITIDNLTNPEMSFILQIDSLKSASLKTTYNDQEFNKLDNNKVRRYLSYFMHIDAERYATELAVDNIEGILTGAAAYIITALERNGTKHTLTLFTISKNDKFDDFGRATTTDLNLCYLQKNGEKVLAVIRWIDVDLLLQSPKFFFTKL
ncbi:MAG: hypothetical protein ACRCY6_06005 [Bacteroidales bacterium]